MALTHKTPFLYESVLMIDQIHTKTVLHLWHLKIFSLQYPANT